MRAFSENVSAFLNAYPLMAIKPTNSNELILEGSFEFVAVSDHNLDIQDCYELRIEVPENFPHTLPRVYEIGSKIPRKIDNHINQEGSLCLGSPLRLRQIIGKDPSLLGFSSKCIVPFLTAHSSGNFLFGELSHGVTGLWQDYKSFLDVQTKQQVYQCLVLASLKRREANKHRCPCGCGDRLGVCTFRDKIHALRSYAPRSWFAAHAYSIAWEENANE